jgi:hypothetical protein
MSLSSPISISCLQNATTTSDEIHEVDKIFHNLNASVTFKASDAVSGPRRKRDPHAFLEQPTSSSSAFVRQAFVAPFLVISALVTVLAGDADLPRDGDSINDTFPSESLVVGEGSPLRLGLLLDVLGSLLLPESCVEFASFLGLFSEGDDTRTTVRWSLETRL